MYSHVLAPKSSAGHQTKLKSRPRATLFSECILLTRIRNTTKHKKCETFSPSRACTCFHATGSKRRLGILTAAKVSIWCGALCRYLCKKPYMSELVAHCTWGYESAALAVYFVKLRPFKFGTKTNSTHSGKKYCATGDANFSWCYESYDDTSISSLYELWMWPHEKYKRVISMRSRNHVRAYWLPSLRIGGCVTLCLFPPKFLSKN